MADYARDEVIKALCQELELTHRIMSVRIKTEFRQHAKSESGEEIGEIIRQLGVLRSTYGQLIKNIEKEKDQGKRTLEIELEREKISCRGEVELAKREKEKLKEEIELIIREGSKEKDNFKTRLASLEKQLAEKEATIKDFHELVSAYKLKLKDAEQVAVPN